MYVVSPVKKELIVDNRIVRAQFQNVVVSRRLHIWAPVSPVHIPPHPPNHFIIIIIITIITTIITILRARTLARRPSLDKGTCSSIRHSTSCLNQNYYKMVYHQNQCQIFRSPDSSDIESDSLV